MENRDKEQALLTETGLVVAVDDDFAYVKTQRTTGCGGCASESGCGTSALSKLFVRENKAPIKVHKSHECNVGDTVELTLDESRLLKHSFMAYGLPLMGLFLFAMVSSFITEGLGYEASMVELVSVVAGFAGLLLGWKYTQLTYKPVLPELGQVLKSEA